MRNFTIIGEATKQIPLGIIKKYPNIPWKQMAGIRDKLMHGYFGIKYDIVWETIKLRLPELKPLIKEVLKQMDKEIENE